jgi:hypothetical protein
MLKVPTSVAKLLSKWVAISVAVLLAGETFARLCLGLGSPPLMVAHPQIEYLLKPDQDLVRFGNQIIVNNFGMRTESFPAKKVDGEFRVMVFGDSVVNGGSQTDHQDLATTIIRKQLFSAIHKNVIVGNISAGSWGPGNWLGYAREFGVFDADVIVLIISSHDFADNPTFAPLDKVTQPTEKPAFALLEVVERYAPRYFPLISSDKNTIETDRIPTQVKKDEILKSLGDLEKFLELAQRESQNVLVFQHWEETEVNDHEAKAGYYSIKEICKDAGVPTISLEYRFRRSFAAGANPYRDNIHPNQIGQKLIAEAIMEELLRLRLDSEKK